MRSRKSALRVGTLVRVGEHYAGDPYLRRLTGTIERRYGDTRSYAAFKVRFDNGRSELFWRDQLEQAAM